MADRIAVLEELDEYVRHVADQMGLGDWDIEILPELPDDEDHLAQISVTFGQRRARLRFVGGVEHWPLERLRRVVVHELVHCHAERIDEAYNVVLAEMGSSARMIAHRMWEAVFEECVDNIATAWANTLPLHQWPDWLDVGSD